MKKLGKWLGFLLLSAVMVILCFTVAADPGKSDWIELERYEFSDLQNKREIQSGTSANVLSALLFRDSADWTSVNTCGYGDTWNYENGAVVSQGTAFNDRGNMIISPIIEIPSCATRITFRMEGKGQRFELRIYELPEHNDNWNLARALAFPQDYHLDYKTTNVISDGIAGETKEKSTFSADVPKELQGKKVAIAFAHLPCSFPTDGTLRLDDIVIYSAEKRDQTHEIRFFETPGATQDYNTATTDSDGHLKSFPIPTHKDGEFLGWTADGKFVDENTVFERDTVLTAEWKRIRNGKTYSISIEGDYPAALMDQFGNKTNVAEAGERIRAVTAGDGLNGLYFHGWEVVKGNPIFSDEKQADARFIMQPGDTVIRPIYNTVPFNHKVTFDAGKGLVNGQKRYSMMTDSQGKLQFIPTALYDDKYEFVGWFNGEIGYLTENQVFEKDMTFTAEFRLKKENDDSYAYWKSPEEDGFVFAYNERNADQLAKAKRYIYLLKDDSQGIYSLEEERVLASFEVTGPKMEFDFTDNVIRHGSGQYYVRLCWIFKESGKDKLQNMGGPYGIAYLEADYLKFKTATPESGEVLNVKVQEKFELSFTVETLPKWMTDRGWQVWGDIAARRVNSNAVLTDWDYQTYAPDQKQGTVYSKTVTVSKAESLEFLFDAKLVQNGGRNVYMSKNDIGIIRQTFTVNVDNTEANKNQILESLKIGNYQFSSEEMQPGQVIKAPNGGWTAAFLDQGGFRTVTVTLNGFYGGPIVAVSSKEHAAQRFTVTANGSCRLTSGGTSYSKDQEYGAISAISTAAPMELVLKLNGKLDITGKVGVLCGLPNGEKTEKAYDDMAALYVYGDGTMNIQAETTGIQCRAPYRKGGKTYQGGFVQLNDASKVNILMDPIDDAVGLDIGDAPYAGLRIHNQSAFCAVAKRGRAMNNGAYTPAASVSKEVSYSICGKPDGKYYFVLPSHYLDLPLERVLPDKEVITTRVNADIRFQIDVKSAYIKENICLRYTLALDDVYTKDENQWSQLVESENGPLSATVSCESPGWKNFRVRATLHAAGVDSLLNSETMKIMAQVKEACTHNFVLKSNTATCTEAGKKTYVCSHCGDTKTENCGALGHIASVNWKDYGDSHARTCQRCGAEMDKAAHEFTIAKQTKSTCTTSSTLYECAKCSATKWITKNITPTHTYGNYLTDANYHWQVCSKCGDIKKESHNYTLTGWGKYRCVCGMYRVENTDPEDIYANVHIVCPHQTATIDVSKLSAEHRTRINNRQYESMTWINVSNGDVLAKDTLSFTPTVAQYEKYKAYDGWIQFSLVFDTATWDMFSVGLEWPMDYNRTSVPEVKATCYSTGVKAHYICPCGRNTDQNFNVISDLTIPKTAHTYDNDCDTSCNVCGAVREASHDFDTAWSHKDGAHYHVCKRCGEQTDYDLCVADGWVEEKKATCTQQGFRYQECTVCKTRLAEETTDFGHEFTDWEEIEKADCTHTGKMTHRCILCGAEEEAVIPALGHHVIRYPEVEANCITEGRDAYYGCTECGKYFADKEGTQEISESGMKWAKNFAHHVGGPVENDETDHWILCACGQEIGKEAHTFNEENICTYCGFKKDGSQGSDTDPTVEPTGETETSGTDDPGKNPGGNGFLKLWWLWLLLLLLIVAAAVTTVVLVKKKNDKKELK